jgi:hypothetical protein
VAKKIIAALKIPLALFVRRHQIGKIDKDEPKPKPIGQPWTN